MNNVLFSVIFLFAMTGAWFTFYKIGEKVGSTRMNNYYCDNLIRVFTLADIDELVSQWEWSEKTEPFIIVNPVKWKYFE